ncbi:RNA 2',3'-cyclic phosphodiesterase [Candidatus Woesearchaeota archaeon]|nr:RNA 2',3'-cyclic phosphodiesterase [Candidatus Woesearchaeota archaeon]
MRLFLAVDIPEEMKQLINDMEAKINPEYGRFNLVKPENCHITLKFLGEVNDEEKIISALKDIKFEPFNLEIKNIGFFPNENYIKVVWIGFKDDSGLVKLHDEIESSLKGFKKDFNFKGHITFMRIKNLKMKKEFIKLMNKIKLPEISFDVNRFKLYKSTLTKEGPVYEVLEEFK